MFDDHVPGLATAKNLAGKGATVCIAGIDPAALPSAKSFFHRRRRPSQGLGWLRLTRG